ncbi:MAG TPA: lipoprotein insertase outer membrane protein LolB [Burkholderiales bacterium]|nr:lipoprotein insertase outer membrane protein LolB [Burkholderiales bacterium]
MRRLRAAALALLAVVLVSCAGLRPTREGPIVVPADVDRFELNGSINLRVQQESFPGRVRWEHQPESDELWFYSPIGTTVAHLRQDPSGALLVTSEGKEYRAKGLRQLAFDVLGWDLPIEALPYWVRGLPWPKAEETEVRRDEQGRLEALLQAGWRVAYLAWDGSGVRGLPSKLDVTGERLRMRLAITRWQLLGNTR